MNKQSHYDKIDEKEQPFKPRNYIKSTAGAIPIRNEKGEETEEAVRVWVGWGFGWGEMGVWVEWGFAQNACDGCQWCAIGVFFMAHVFERF